MTMLQAAELDSATAQELINASEAVGWSNLYSILTKLAARTMGCAADVDRLPSFTPVAW